MYLYFVPDFFLRVELFVWFITAVALKVDPVPWCTALWWIQRLYGTGLIPETWNKIHTHNKTKPYMVCLCLVHLARSVIWLFTTTNKLNISEGKVIRGQNFFSPIYSTCETRHSSLIEMSPYTIHIALMFSIQD